MTPYSGVAPDIQAALSDLQAAESVYHECTGDTADEAWFILQAARLRLSRLIREAKNRGAGNNGQAAALDA